jgi:hypothetical protein
LISSFSSSYNGDLASSFSSSAGDAEEEGQEEEGQEEEGLYTPGVLLDVHSGNESDEYGVLLFRLNCVACCSRMFLFSD